MISTPALLSLTLLLGATNVLADICYDGYGRSYYCNNSGLSYGARIGIGIGIALAVVLLFSLCGYWRRRQIRNSFSQHRPPALPFTSGQGQGQNPYASNPPPPTQGAYGYNNYQQGSNYSSNPYGNNPAPPAQTYQPSTANQYKAPSGAPPAAAGAGGAVGEQEHEHGYEWAQAREQERLEREQAAASGVNEPAPPGYDVATSTHNTGNTTSGYTPPSGPPPGKRNAEGTV